MLATPVRNSFFCADGNVLFLNSNAAYFPAQVDAGLGFHVGADAFAEIFDVGGRRIARIDHEVAVLLAHLRAAHAAAAAAGGDAPRRARGRRVRCDGGRVAGGRGAGPREGGGPTTGPASDAD